MKLFEQKLDCNYGKIGGKEKNEKWKWTCSSNYSNVIGNEKILGGDSM